MMINRDACSTPFKKNVCPVGKKIKDDGMYNIKSTPDNSNLQRKSKKVRVIGSSKNIAGSKDKNGFYCRVNILIRLLIVEMSSKNQKILLDYKSERNVTKRSLNRACVLLF